MRTKKEIENSFNKLIADEEKTATEKTAIKLSYVVELLLDIRDLLATPPLEEK